MKTVAIIPTGGSGRRMGGSIAKQYLPLAGIPLLVHTLSTFQKSSVIDDIFLIIPEGDFLYVRQMIIEKYGLSKVSRILTGGRQRQDSVKNGLDVVGTEHSIIVIHDGVRPFISEEMLHRIVIEALQAKAVTFGIPAKDTVKTIGASGWVRETLNRDGLCLTQTPQAFERQIIKKAYQTAGEDHFYGTDDASLVERIGIKVKMIPGSYDNIKITTRDDLVLGEFLIGRQKEISRG
ncbi:MAG: 2-C-methyl-D-erythritol 4-phosphate cytidylyltransferase [Syntrophales bacterium]